MERYLDASLAPELRAEDLLARMSLEEKMGQVVGALPLQLPQSLEQIKKDYPHGVGSLSCLWMIWSGDLQTLAEYQRQLQDLAMSLSEHHIPAMFHMEGLNGTLMQDGATFPVAIARGAGWNPALEREIGRIVGKEADALGVSQVFAPVLDVTRDARFGRHAESYSEDAALVSAMGTAYAKGVQENMSNVRVESVAKHYLGYHASPNGIHASSSNITERELREVFAKPFQAAITEACLRGVMPAYCSINGEPLSVSRAYLTGLLRDEMGFDGVTVSDYSAVMELHERQKVADSLAKAGYLSLLAGMDVELPTNKARNEELLAAFANGDLDAAVLDKAVLRVLTAKFRMGLFENPYAVQSDAVKSAFYMGTEEAVSRQSALESMVLLKNTGVLPLNKNQLKGKRIAVIGCHADSIRIMYGGYTYMSFSEARFAAANTMEGIAADRSNTIYDTYPGTVVQRDNPGAEKGARMQKPGVKSLLEELKTVFSESDIQYEQGYDYTGNDMSMHGAALDAARDADLVILTLGGKYGTSTMSTMGEGIDSTSINLPPCQEELIGKLADLGKPTVAVHFDGRPISSDAADRYIDAILEAWCPSDYGAEAVVSVLTGEYNPGGKLPVSVAYNAGQEPMYYSHPNGSSYHQNTESAFRRYIDYPHEPRYYFGYGLSYTTFSYNKLEVENSTITGDQPVRLIVEVANTGNRAGDEVVQVYARDCYASVLRPNMELVGFYRAHLEPGEVKKLQFTFSAGQLAYIGLDNQWILEAGDIEILVGAASNDIRLTDKLKVSKDIYVNERTRGFYAQVEELQR